MLRNILSPCRNSKCTTFLCVTSLCINVFLIISTRHMRPDLVKYTANADASIDDTYYKFLNWNSSNSHERLLDHLASPSSATSTQQPHYEPEKEIVHNDTVCNFCPLDPPGLLGNLADMMQEMNAETLSQAFPDMKAARIKPEDCVARQTIAILIPYRHRYPHLHILLHNLIPFLTRQQADATFFVIEQAMPETFNRGALLNVGFVEAEKIHKFDCYIFHDVDLIPLDDRHLYRCGDDPKHLSVAMNKYNFKLPYKDYFGGAVAFSRRQFMDINGCSNVYFGWGGEDDELRHRVYNKGYIIYRSPVTIARYAMIKHSRDKGNEANPVRKRILSTSKKRQEVDGLNTITYKVNSIKFENLYIWINVSLNRTDILKKSPALEAILEPKQTTLTPKVKAEELTLKRNGTVHQKNESPRELADSSLPNNSSAKQTAEVTKHVKS